MQHHRFGIAFSAVGLVLAGLVGMTVTSGAGAAEAPPTTVKIALFRNADAPVLDPEFEGFKETFIKESGLSPDNVTWIKKNAHGSTNACTTIARQLKGMELDGIAVAGTTCIVAMSAQDQVTPVFALGMGHPVGAGVAKTIDQPGANVTGSWRGEGNAGPVVEAISTLEPEIKTLGIMYASANESTAIWVKRAEETAQKLGMKTRIIGVTSTTDVVKAARTLTDEIDAFLLPPDGVIAAGLPGVSAVAIKAGVPVYTSGLVITGPVKGVVADYGKSYYDMGALAAQNAVKVIMDGADPATTPFRAVHQYTWHINGKAAAKYEVTFPDEVNETAVFFK